MARLLLIANPLASGFTGGTHREVLQILSGRYDVESLWPNNPEDTREATAKAVANGFDVVAAMGGDGVVHHVANGLAYSETALGIIPAGTTNVLARILKLPSKAAAAATYLASEPTTHRVPMARIDGAGPSKRLAGFAVFAAGLGLDAEVVRQAEAAPHRKYFFGGLHYARSAAWMFVRHFRNRPPSIRVVSGDEKADAVAVMTQIHWPYTYFGSIPLRITRRPVPGLSALVIEKAPVSRAAMLGITALWGRGLARVPGVSVWPRLAKLAMEADPPAWFQSDGEMWGQLSELHIQHAEDALLVASPVST